MLFTILETSYINDKIVGPGERVSVDDSAIPGPHWQPEDPIAKKSFIAAGFTTPGPAGDPVLRPGFGSVSP